MIKLNLLSFIERHMLIIAILALFLPSVLVITNEAAKAENSYIQSSQNSQNPQVLAEQENLIEPEISKTPEISGWIAWWAEDDGYNVAFKNSDKISTISPGWFKLDKNMSLVELGKVDKLATSQKSKELGIKLYPMVVTDLTDSELAVFIKNEVMLNRFIEDLLVKAKLYNLAGFDLDFENIHYQYTNEFSELVKRMSDSFKKNNLYFSVTVQAKTKEEDIENINGQDLRYIAKIADEVRIMVYDRHGEFSESGAITPMQWFKDVIEYNSSIIPKKKMVIALPTYGYIWFRNKTFRSYQFKEFTSYISNREYISVRDPESFELQYINSESVGWLSDSVAVKNKIEYARSHGHNRFAIWNLSGTDEAIFDDNFITTD